MDEIFKESMMKLTEINQQSETNIVTFGVRGGGGDKGM